MGRRVRPHAFASTNNFYYSILFTVFIQKIGVGPVACYSESESEAGGGAVIFRGGAVYWGNT